MSGQSLSLGVYENLVNEEAKLLKIPRSHVIQRSLKLYFNDKKTRKIQIYLLYIILSVLIVLQVFIVVLVNGG